MDIILKQVGKRKTLSYWKDIVRYYWERLVLHISVFFFFFCIRFALCLSVVTVVSFLKIKKCKNDTYIKKGENQLRVILFVRFRIPHVCSHITSTSLTLKPSRFVRSLSTRNNNDWSYPGNSFKCCTIIITVLLLWSYPGIHRFCADAVFERFTNKA